jgi:hypothetical protein
MWVRGARVHFCACKDAYKNACASKKGCIQKRMHVRMHVRIDLTDTTRVRQQAARRV